MGAVASTNIVTDALVGCWDAGNRISYPGAGTTWTDVVGGYNGTLTNMDTGGFDPQNSGVIIFDGTNEYVDFGSYIPTVVTVDFWIWIDSDMGSGALIYQGDDAYSESSADWFMWRSHLGLRLVPQGTGSPVYIPSGGYYDIAGNGQQDTWINIVMVRDYDGSNAIAYINGVSIGTSTRGTTNAKVFRMIKAGSNYAEGKLGPVRLYNRALTHDEILQNYEATKPRFVPRITKSGLVGNWDAGDPNSYSGGSTWKDTANDNNGTLSGDTFFNTAGGGSFTFNSADDYVTIANESNFDIGTACTITAWVYLDSLGDSDYGRIIDKASALSSSTLDGFHFHCNTSNSFGAAVGCSTTNARSVSATSVLSLNTWMHLVMVFNEDGSKKIKQYKDGLKLTLATDTAGAGSIDNSSVSPRIGNYAGDTSRSFDGDIAVVRFYDKALSAAEIMDNYQKTKGRFGH